MKKLLWMSVISLAIVTGITLVAAHTISEVQARERKLKEEFDRQVEALRSTDARFPRSPDAGAGRFEAFLRVRADVARFLERRIDEQARSAFHARETQNRLLAQLRERLVEEKMGLGEFRATAARLESLIARQEQKRLREAWAKGTRTSKHPEGLPLPEPAPDAKPDELERLRLHTAEIEATMAAGLMGPLLERVAEAGG